MAKSEEVDDELKAIAHRAMRGWFRSHWRDEETEIWRKRFSRLIQNCQAQNIPYFLALVIILIDKIAIDEVARMIPKHLRISLAGPDVTLKDMHLLNAITLVEILDGVTDFREVLNKMTVSEQNNVSFSFMRKWVNSLTIVSQETTPPAEFFSVCRKGGVEKTDALKLFEALI